MEKIDVTCVIDDDAVYNYTVKRAFDTARFTKKLLMFPNGQMALDYFTSHINDLSSLPDLVLLDVNMPVLDGWQFLERFTMLKPNIGKKITIYIISSSIMEEDLARAKAISEVTDYIIKPITPEKLISILDHWNSAGE